MVAKVSSSSGQLQNRSCTAMAPLKSDIKIDASKFEPSAISKQTEKLNQHIIDIFEPVPKWYEVGLEKSGPA